MADLLTPTKGLTIPTVGADDNIWGTILNSTIELIDSALGGTITVSIVGNTVLTTTQAQNAGYVISGSVGSTTTITWPSYYGLLVVKNNTGQSIICGITGTTVTINATNTVAIWSDGINFTNLSTGSQPQPATAVPLMVGSSGVIGSSLLYARQDHVHQSSNAPIAYRLLNIQTFSIAGTFTYTPTAGTESIIVEGCGGGGGSGGLPATDSSHIAMNLGGGSGAWGISYSITSGFSGTTIVVGAAGTAGTTSSGGNGGNSLFGLTMLWPGGLGGGPGGPNVIPSNTFNLQARAGAPTGSFSEITPGNLPSGGIWANASGGGGPVASIGAAGPWGQATNGAGGDGNYVVFSGSSANGTAGYPGRVRIYEYS